MVETKPPSTVNEVSTYSNLDRSQPGMKSDKTGNIVIPFKEGYYTPEVLPYNVNFISMPKIIDGCVQHVVRKGSARDITYINLTTKEEKEDPGLDWLWINAYDTDEYILTQNGKEGTQNAATGEVVLSPLYDKVALAGVAEGLYQVVKDGSTGYVNKNNEVIIPFEYREYTGSLSNPGAPASPFRNGLVIVQNKQMLYGLLNTKNEVILPFGSYIERIITSDDKVDYFKVGNVLYDNTGTIIGEFNSLEAFKYKFLKTPRTHSAIELQ